jgi:AcrR family transcriptional regulator
MGAVATEVRSTTRARILDAAFEAVRDFGVSRTTVEDVAQRAGLSRQTVYRYFPSKEHVVLGLVLREEEKFIEGTRAAFSSHDELAEAFEAAIAFCLGYAREHPLLDRLLATDRETFLPYLTVEGLPVILRARESLIELVRERRPKANAASWSGILDAAVRATLSYILTPPERPIPEVARAMSRALVAALSEADRGRP